MKKCKFFIFIILCFSLLSFIRANIKIKKIEGSWKTQDGLIYIKFSNNKCIWCESGKIVVYNIGYINRAFKLKNWMVTYGKEIKYKYRLRGSKLHIVGEDSKKYILSRIEQIPEKCDVTPLKLGKKKKLAKSYIQKIISQLKKRAEEDQSVRTDPQKAMKFQEVDKSNTRWLSKLVRRIGWIDAQRFGKEATNNAFLIVQHSKNIKLMLAVLPEIEKDAKAGLIDPQPFSLLYDRTKLYLGEKQRYGTQIITTPGGKRVIPAVESKDKIEKFRSEINLFPFSIYLAILKKAFGLNENEEIEILEK